MVLLGNDGGVLSQMSNIFSPNEAETFEPVVDSRKPDKLVCPTCLAVHLPVEGAE